MWTDGDAWSGTSNILIWRSAHLIQRPLESNVGEPDGTTHALGVQETQCPLLRVRRTTVIDHIRLNQEVLTI